MYMLNYSISSQKLMTQNHKFEMIFVIINKFELSTIPMLNNYFYLAFNYFNLNIKIL